MPLFIYLFILPRKGLSLSWAHFDLALMELQGKSAAIFLFLATLHGTPVAGSVNGSNCDELAKQEDIDGFLVGGASLKVSTCIRGHEFHAIIPFFLLGKKVGDFN